MHARFSQGAQLLVLKQSLNINKQSSALYRSRIFMRVVVLAGIELTYFTVIAVVWI